jgi:DnaK suppressor protein
MEWNMEYHAHPDSELSDEQLSQLVDTLTQKQNSLTQQNEELQRLITQKQDCSILDFADAARLKDESLRASILFDKNQEFLQQIARAFVMLKNGRYGVSTVTGEPIPIERLLIVPWTSTCIEDIST